MEAPMDQNMDVMDMIMNTEDYMNADEMRTAIDELDEQVQYGVDMLNQGLSWNHEYYGEMDVDVDGLDLSLNMGDENLEIHFDELEVEEWANATKDALMQNEQAMDALVVEWIHQMWDATKGPFGDLHELGLERDALVEEAIMDMADYLGEHISVDGKTLNEWCDSMAEDMMNEFPMEEMNWDEFMNEDWTEYDPTALFGLDHLKMDGTDYDMPVMEIPNIEFNFNESYVMSWLADVQAEGEALMAEHEDSVRTMVEEIMQSLMDAHQRDMDIAPRAFELDSRVTQEAIDYLFNTITVDGVSAADMFPTEHNMAIRDALQNIREGYEMFGMNMTATDAEAMAQDALDNMFNFDHMEMNSFVQKTEQSSNMLPYAVGGAALLAGGLYFFSRKSAQKENTTAFLSQ